MRETIDRAALLTAMGVFSLPRPNRHADVIRHIHELFGDFSAVGAQGFITSTGRFVGREEAGEIAAAAGQMRNAKYLYSEDLW